MQKQRIAIGGSAADPPHLGHRALLEALFDSNLFDKIIWVVSGQRHDKDFSIRPVDRVNMTQMMKRSLKPHPATQLVDIYDDAYGENTPTIDRLEALREEYPDAQLTWFTGADSVVPRLEYGGRCEIEELWHRGKELMADWDFLVITRQGYPKPENLPPRFKVLDVELPNISSTDVRMLAMIGHSIDHLVPSRVADYIKELELYKDSVRQAYAGYFSVVKFPTEHGFQEIVKATDSVSVLFYDATSRQVLLTKQFRPAMIRPDNPQGVCIEPVAGRFDVDLGFKALVIKEAKEEVGATITEDDIIALNDGVPMSLSSGLTTEKSYMAFVEIKPGMVEKSDKTFGVDTEGERINQVWMDIDEFLSQPTQGVRTFAFKEWLRNRLNKKGETE